MAPNFSQVFVFFHGSYECCAFSSKALVMAHRTSPAGILIVALLQQLSILLLATDIHQIPFTIPAIVYPIQDRRKKNKRDRFIFTPNFKVLYESHSSVCHYGLFPHFHHVGLGSSVKPTTPATKHQ